MHKIACLVRREVSISTLHLSKGVLLADVVSIIGTLDIVFGEIDR